MPATDHMTPPMTPAERAVVKSYRSWTAFMNVYGLKAHDSDDIKQAHEIVKRMAKGK